ncbi:MAG: TetR/AcrR family transcriptional regulator [Paracoccaceae bacterium]
MTAPIRAAIPTQDMRVAEILGRARTAFAEKGFDGASMQDIARSAGMSVGNFYRYFPSKAAMLEALIAADMQEMEADFAQVLGSDDPMQRLRELIRFRLTDDANCADDGRVWAEITAASMRKPEIAALSAKMGLQITEYLCAVFARVLGIAVAEAEARFASHANFIVLMVKTAVMTPPETCPVHDDLMVHVQRTIDQTLDDILNMRKGIENAQ